ncbi:Glycoside hydrolase [Parasponia andersonii]|uniref:glucan endo-1,3-beta-D-glucosidase n=1 Tax=Parasponia andersonii TaxID=3476 RepID=A0A2P5AIE7_PARAD|nr:Glycoside hydrolase [Parasponia andersonii]
MSFHYSFSLSLTLSLLLFLSPLAGATSFPLIGATYSVATAGTHGHSLSPVRIAAAAASLGLSTVRLDHPEPATVRAFLYSNTTLLLNVPNPLVPAMAANRSSALQWLYALVVPFFPRARITTISVGNDLLEAFPEHSSSLLPAMENLHLALRDLGIRTISVSTTFSFVNVVASFFPPSAAQFREPALGNVISPLLQFLRDTNSSFLINVYPYNVFRTHGEIPIGYALFQGFDFGFREDVVTGVRYRNLFDVMVDAVICAMAVSGHENIPVIVTETGWPSSSGDTTEVDANPAYAELYIRGLVKYLKSGAGTPLRKEGVAEAYIYELFDKEEKQGNGMEMVTMAKQNRSWGILYPNMTKKYDIDFSGSIRLYVGRFDWLVILVGSLVSFALFHV